MNTQKTDWNDIHVAYQVAKKGTLTAAAEALDVHHSTVLRRINALEKRLGTRLFHRHARGYTPTEAGILLTQVAENTQNQFDRLVGQLQGVDTQLTGTLVITSVNNMLPNVVPLLAEFQQLYPEIRLEYVADSRILKLEHGEAHISIRPGAKPKDPDYVVQPLATLDNTIYANNEYISQHGLMTGLADISGHRFISTVAPRRVVPYMRWMSDCVPDEQIYFRANDFSGFLPAVKAGLGAAPMSCWFVNANAEAELKPLLPAPEEWQISLWLVTHRDLHRTSKVQVFTQFLKARFGEEQANMKLALPG